MSGADLRGYDLNHIRLDNCLLNHADLRGCRFDKSTIALADLADCLITIYTIMNIKYSANFKMIGSNGELTSISLCDLRDLFPIGFSLASKIDDETIVISYPDAGRKSRIVLTTFWGISLPDAAVTLKGSSRRMYITSRSLRGMR